MENKKNIFIIIGSAGENSANQKLMNVFAELTQNEFELTFFKDLKALPHFDPELSAGNPPQSIVDFRNAVNRADGVIICTPEYVFSIPSGLKNAIEWCVATTVFSNKPTGIITASAHGQKGHEELQLIMRTLMAKLSPETNLLIPGIKGKINPGGEIILQQVADDLLKFCNAFEVLLVKVEE